ncbi:helix-turn-helix domain-containing protein [Patescibacteria group bacterium]|nr:helix-turn-helix domain-containing protein [Patescibacteria group bacterium]
MKNKRFLSTTELAKILKISRVAVYKKIKRGEIEAIKVGRNFIIDKKLLGSIFNEELTKKEKLEIEKSVKKTIKEYGETLRLLGAS